MSLDNTPPLPAPALGESLRQSEERFKLLVEGVRDYAIFMLDPEGHVESWNAGAELIKGYTKAEIVGQHFSTFYTPSDLAAGKPWRLLMEAVKNGRVEDEGWRVRKDGSRFWADAILTALRGKDGELRGFAKVTRDLTERRKMQALEESTRRINEFLAMLAHELRNPLAPIRNAVSLMQHHDLTDAHFQWAREVIDRQVTHLTHLVDDLLDMSRITTGKITLRRQVIDVNEVIARAVETTRPQIDERGQQLEVTTPATPLHVNGDLTRLAQVVLNLLNNASKYTPERGHIWLALSRERNNVVIKVRDNGIGMSADLLPKVFDLFAQGERSLDRSEGGLGIGLTLVRRLVEMHGGQVDATSEGRNRGSTFTVRLPLVEVVSTDRHKPPIIESQPNACRILVVDDNHDSAESMALLMQMAGHDTRTASDGPTAIALAQEYRPQVVLLDLGLPEMSGFEVAQRIRALPGMGDVVLIAMTGYGQEEDRRQTAAAGFAEHLVKPIDATALHVAVQQATRDKC